MTITNTPSNKVTIFLEDLAGGGAQRSLINLANELVTHNYQVEFALFNKGGVFIPQVSPKVNIVFLEAKR